MAAKNHNFWTVEYYQKYFDVNTDDVIQRILSSVVPQRAGTGYFDQTIRAKPDMYGPFWISTTLVSIHYNIYQYTVLSQDYPTTTMICHYFD